MMTDEEKDRKREQEECKFPDCFVAACGIDKEIKELCHSLNSISGVKTFDSCCGHGSDPIWVWFTVGSVKDLNIIAKCTNPNYSGSIGDDFECIVDNSDVRGAIFRLRSKSVGDTAYENGKKLAENILKEVSLFDGGLQGAIDIADGPEETKEEQKNE